MEIFRHLSKESLLLRALAIVLLLTGGQCASESMSCSMVNGRTVCESRKSDGNTAAAFSGASYGKDDAHQDAIAMTGDNFAGAFPFRGQFPNFQPNHNVRPNINKPQAGFNEATKTESHTRIVDPSGRTSIYTNGFGGTANNHGIPRPANGVGTFPLNGQQLPNFHPNYNVRPNINRNHEAGAMKTTMTESHTKIVYPSSRMGINTNGFGGTANNNGMPGTAVGVGTFQFNGHQAPNFFPNRNVRPNINGNPLDGGMEVPNTESHTRIFDPRFQLGINTNGFGSNVNNNGIPGHTNGFGTSPLNGHQIPNYHPNNNIRPNITSNPLSGALEVVKTESNTSIVDPTVRSDINATSFGGILNNNGSTVPANSVGTFPLNGDQIPNYHPNDNIHPNITSNPMPSSMEIAKTESNTSIVDPRVKPGINTNGFGGIVNNNGSPGPTNGVETFPLNGDQIPNYHPNSNIRPNINSNPLDGAMETPNTESNTRILDPGLRTGINTNGFGGTVNRNGIPGPAINVGTFRLNGHQFPNFHPNNNVRPNINSNHQAGFMEATKTESHTRIVDPSGRTSIYTNGFGGTTNNHEIARPANGVATFPLNEHRVPNFHPNNNVRPNINRNHGAGVIKTTMTESHTRIVDPGIRTDINTNGFGVTRNNNGMAGPSIGVGTFQLNGHQIPNFHPNLNVHPNINRNPLAGAMGATKTDSNTGIVEPWVRIGVNTNGFGGTVNNNGFPGPGNGVGTFNFDGYMAPNFHPNNGGWNMISNGVAAGVSEAKRTAANTGIVGHNDNTGINRNDFAGTMSNGHGLPGNAYDGFAVANAGNLNMNDPSAFVNDVFRSVGVSPAFPWNGFGKRR